MYVKIIFVNCFSSIVHLIWLMNWCLFRNDLFGYISDNCKKWWLTQDIHIPAVFELELRKLRISCWARQWLSIVFDWRHKCKKIGCDRSIIWSTFSDVFHRIVSLPPHDLCWRSRTTWLTNEFYSFSSRHVMHRSNNSNLFRLHWPKSTQKHIHF